MVHSSRPRRHFIKRKRGDAHLEERDPSLINLPFPLPSIPVISNLLDPLISGEKPHQVSSSSVQAPAPTATSAPSSPSNSDTGSSGDNSASSSGSGDNGSNSSDNDTGSVSGSSPSSGSESGSGSNGSSPTVSSAASPAPVATGKGSSFVDTTDPKPTSSQGAVASPSVASTSAAAAATSSVPTEATDVNSTEAESLGSATSTASNAPSSPIANVAAAIDNSDSSSSAVQGAGISSSHSAQPTAIGSLGAGVGSSSSSSSSSGSSAGTDNNSSSVNAETHSSLSGGALAGIILAALVAGGLLVLFVMRRRAINKRKAHQTAWFTGRNNVNTNSNDPARISTRSSWGTPYDGRALYTDAMSPTPDAMGQLNSAPLTAPPVVVTQKQNSRASMYSIGSASSEGSGEGPGLPLPAPVHGEDMPSTPMSARAFSPTDGYTFPKPPSTISAGTIKEEKRKSVDELIDLNNPFEDRLPPGASPFADPIVPVTPGARASVGSSVGSAGSVIGIGTRVAIARPFTPNLHDEIGVSLGDEVIVLQAFDDGWVQIRNVNKDVGLIPLDCFRAEGQDPATFLASKRVSSFFQAGFLQ